MKWLTPRRAPNSSTPLTFATRIVPSAVAGTPYVLVLDAAGGTPGYTWSIAAGQLPAGVTFSPATGVISGTPTVSGNFSIAVTLTDAASPHESRTTTVTISVAAPPKPVQPLMPPAAHLHHRRRRASLSLRPFRQRAARQLTTGRSHGGTLPAGLALDPTTGTISGTPLASGTAVVKCNSARQQPPVLTQLYTHHAQHRPRAARHCHPDTSSGPSRPHRTFKFCRQAAALRDTAGQSSSGALPAGLTLSPFTGTIYGKPVTSGSSTSPSLSPIAETQRR